MHSRPVALHAAAPSDDLVAAAAACGDPLLRSAQETAVSVGWPSALYKGALAGFPHGPSGIATFLLRLRDSARNRGSRTPRTQHWRTNVAFSTACTRLGRPAARLCGETGPGSDGGLVPWRCWYRAFAPIVHIANIIAEWNQRVEYRQGTTLRTGGDDLKELV